MSTSLDIKTNFSLKRCNTFAIDAYADKFIAISSVDELAQALDQISSGPFLVLGGGSNLLLDQSRIHQPVLWINNKGIEVLKQTEAEVLVRAGAGENWHELVLWSIERGFGGLENLSLIPGNVGAAPVQNIGAYGVELKDVLHQVEVMNLATGEVELLGAEECSLGYRDSVFKSTRRGRWIIMAVIFRLTRMHHQLRLEYGSIQNRLAQSAISEPTIRDVSNAVIRIRQERLPDPAQLPNAGSFFKNPLVSVTQYETLKEAYPDIPCYEQPDASLKLPAAWLIESCQWKGVRRGDVGVHEQHALVLVNYGRASGGEIIELAQEIQHSVFQRFAIQLDFEVNLASKSLFGPHADS